MLRSKKRNSQWGFLSLAEFAMYGKCAERRINILVMENAREITGRENGSISRKRRECKKGLARKKTKV